MFELTLDGPASLRPYLDVRWHATFRQGDTNITVPGFWDGGRTYTVRFSPPTVGEWRYETHSAAPELDGKTGAFVAAAPTGQNHGPVEVFDTYYLRYADGTPFHQFGTTCYAWIHQMEALQEQTLKTLAASPFNKIRFCIFPKSYAYNQNEPERFAFEKNRMGGSISIGLTPCFGGSWSGASVTWGGWESRRTSSSGIPTIDGDSPK